ncbi:unnamed protein product [Brachionus calyciflorus]|uniref:Uncharacterized protein n=1 Tax=Brachionus calyciflorus TaxID=104777 RepID=A0A813M375_9BILA|nr:unnamed protein product [Brachionus calyciflorus]
MRIIGNICEIIPDFKACILLSDDDGCDDCDDYGDCGDDDGAYGVYDDDVCVYGDDDDDDDDDGDHDDHCVIHVKP